MLRKSFKYRLYPNANQTREMEITLETHRRLYNQALDDRQFVYEMSGKSIGFFFQSKRFTVLKRTNPHYQRLNRNSVSHTLKRLDVAFSGFFARLKRGERCGYPRFKSRDRFNGFSFDVANNGGGCKLIDRKLRLQYIGDVRINLHRPLEGKAKRCRLVRDAGKWYAIFLCEIDADIPIHNGPVVGIDVGIKSFVATSDGEIFGAPHPLRNGLGKLRRVNKKLSRAKRGSKRRRKVVTQLQRLHKKMRDTRSDHHHKVARQLVDRYSFIAAESLRVENMLKNRRLSRAISDVGWYSFLQILTAKAESAGSRVVLVNAAQTSQECSNCGAIVRKSLAVRVHRCECGLVLDRDINAAINILARTEPTNAKVETAQLCS